MHAPFPSHLLFLSHQQAPKAGGQVCNHCREIGEHCYGLLGFLQGQKNKLGQ